MSLKVEEKWKRNVREEKKEEEEERSEGTATKREKDDWNNLCVFYFLNIFLRNKKNCVCLLSVSTNVVLLFRM